MANLRTNVVVPGGDGAIQIVVSPLITMASGAATFAHGLRKFKVVGASVVHASAVPDESWGIAGTPNADGWLISNTGVSNVDSSNGSSSSTGWITLIGYGL